MLVLKVLIGETSIRSRLDVGDEDRRDRIRGREQGQMPRTWTALMLLGDHGCPSRCLTHARDDFFFVFFQ